MSNKLTYPMKVMGISQSYKGSFSHAKYYNGKPNDYPIDDAGKDRGKDSVFCPCNKMKVKRIYGVGNSGTNTIWLESTSKVRFANGKSDYCVLMIVHPNDDTLKGIKVGQTFKRGEKITTEGMDGHATGNHVHLSVGSGKFTGNGWVKNNLGGWPLICTGSPMKPEDAFFVDTEFTKILNSAGLKFKKVSEYVAPKKTVSYYPKCSASCTTITAGLSEIGVVLTYANREKIAKANGIKSYKGTAAQNTKMLKLLKKGNLVRV